MLQTSTKPQTFYSGKENHINCFTIELFREAHKNALSDESWCPKEVYTAAAQNKVINIICETEAEALALAQYHFCLTGSNFKIIGNEPYQRFK